MEAEESKKGADAKIVAIEAAARARSERARAAERSGGGAGQEVAAQFLLFAASGGAGHDWGPPGAGQRLPAAHACDTHVKRSSRIAIVVSRGALPLSCGWGQPGPRLLNVLPTLREHPGPRPPNVLLTKRQPLRSPKHRAT